jgi:membrane fusion protein (multidrug efflux system)
MKKRTILIVLIIGALAATGTILIRGGFSGKAEAVHPAPRKKPPTVRAVEAVRSTISRTLDLTGSVEPYRTARLASPAEGPVRDLRVREGDPVKPGDALLAIGRKKGIDAQIVSLRQELQKEKDNLERTRQLVACEALPGEQLDQARAAFEEVRAQLVRAEETALDYAIAAPWNGVVSSVLVKEGEFVAPRTALLEMYDPSSLVIRAAVPEKYAAGISAGMAVSVSLDAWPDDLMQGHIARVYPYLDPRLRTQTLEITLDKPVDLLPGMFARLKVLLKTEDHAVTVPVEALVAMPNGGSVVFVAVNGKAIARPVETGIEADNRIQIVAGIQAGDQVIVAGNEKLKDGAGVRLAGEPKSAKGRPLSMAAPLAAPKNQAGDERQ